jgi:ABC-type branched-subunit amino acid transport system ATPase component
MRGVTKRYGTLDALKDVTFTIKQGKQLDIWDPTEPGRLPP